MPFPKWGSVKLCRTGAYDAYFGIHKGLSFAWHGASACPEMTEIIGPRMNWVELRREQDRAEQNEAAKTRETPAGVIILD